MMDLEKAGGYARIGVEGTSAGERHYDGFASRALAGIPGIGLCYLKCQRARMAGVGHQRMITLSEKKPSK